MVKATDASETAGGSRSAVVVVTGGRRRRFLRMARAVVRAEGGWVVGTGEWWERLVGGSDWQKVATEADVWKEMRRGRPSGRLLVGRVTGGGGGGEVAGAGWRWSGRCSCGGLRAGGGGLVGGGGSVCIRGGGGSGSEG